MEGRDEFANQAIKVQISTDGCHFWLWLGYILVDVLDMRVETRETSFVELRKETIDK